MNVEMDLNNTLNKILIEFDHFIHNCLIHKSSLRTVRSKETPLYSKAKIIRDKTQPEMYCYDCTNSYCSIGYSIRVR